MPMQNYTAAQVLESKALFNGLVHLLDLSFANDTLTNWLFRDHSRQEYLKRLKYYHRYLLGAALRSGASTTVISDDTDVVLSQTPASLPSRSNIKAIAVLISPSGNTSFDSPFTHIRAGLLSFLWHGRFKVMSSFLGEFVPKLNAMISDMYPAPNQHKKHEQWHLLFLATHPDCQGQGLGKKLLLECQRVVAEFTLKERMLGKEVGPLYLESSTLGSRRLYKRVGFVDQAEMAYGTCEEGEAIATNGNGNVVGGRLFALTWTP